MLSKGEMYGGAKEQAESKAPGSNISEGPFVTWRQESKSKRLFLGLIPI